MNDPIMVAEYTGPKDDIKKYGQYIRQSFAGGKPVVVGVVVHLDRSGQNVVSNIRTIHARSNFAKQITEDSLLYLNPNKGRTRSWFQVCGISNVPLDGIKYGFIRRIAFDSGEVKGKDFPDPQAETFTGVYDSRVTVL